MQAKKHCPENVVIADSRSCLSVLGVGDAQCLVHREQETEDEFDLTILCNQILASSLALMTS